MSERLTQLARAQTQRRTALPAEAYERKLNCESCGDLIAVFEAATGASTAAEHEHVDPEAFRCGRCLGAE